MAAKSSSKVLWGIFAFAVAITILTIEELGQIFFINRTSSMPKGIYMKTWNKGFNVGDIIVFNSKSLSGNLIKYIAANASAEYCYEGALSFWVDGFPYSPNYIQIINPKIPSQSVCFQLKKDELIVLGEHPNSYDSRYFGAVKIKEVLAKVKFVYAFK